MLCLGPEANTKPVKLIEQCENCAGQCGVGSQGSSKFSLVVDDEDGDVVGVDSEGHCGYRRYFSSQGRCKQQFCCALAAAC